MLFGVQIYTSAWGVNIAENDHAIYETWFCLIFIKTTTVWSKNFLAAIKSAKFYCTVRAQPNQTHLLYGLFTCSRDWSSNVECGIPMTHNITSLKTHQEVRIVNWTSPTLNWNEWESKARSWKKYNVTKKVKSYGAAPKYLMVRWTRGFMQRRK